MTRDEWLEMEDAGLLAQCRQEFFIATGPGGQHRNKTQTAVRLIHEASGQTVTATNNRQREVNRTDALAKLRMSIALECRMDNAPLPELPPPSERQPIRFPLFAARLLDHLQQFNYSLADTAKVLNSSTGQLSRIICKSPDLLQKVNRERTIRGLHPLKP